MLAPEAFAPRLLAWFAEHGRHDLPWQHPRTPYRVWVAEVMLQQTQVSTVIPYFERFMRAFPDVETLAATPLDTVLAQWQGLGYYARARNLHRAAGRIVEMEGFPTDRVGWEALPGIGRSTAAAIVAQAFGQREAILDGNVKRVLCRLFGIEGWPGEKGVEKRLWVLAESLLPEDASVMPDYTQAQMDLGATVCTRARPHCKVCPFADVCEARRSDRIACLPTPRPRRRLPVRREIWGVVLAEGHVWLQQRPARGLWGGLWTLPVLAQSRGRRLPALRHTFTHFHLDIEPCLWHTRLDEMPFEQGMWQPLAQLETLALPVPVRKILKEIVHEPKSKVCETETGTGGAEPSAVSRPAGTEDL